jgi:thiamine monophosphate synthase
MRAGRLSGFYFITDSGLTSRGVRDDVAAALAGGAALVQYREKLRSFDERLAEARDRALPGGGGAPHRER